MGLFYIKPARMPNIKIPGFRKLDALQRPKLLKIPQIQLCSQKPGAKPTDNYLFFNKNYNFTPNRIHPDPVEVIFRIRNEPNSFRHPLFVDKTPGKTIPQFLWHTSHIPTGNISSQLIFTIFSGLRY